MTVILQRNEKFNGKSRRDGIVVLFFITLFLHVALALENFSTENKIIFETILETSILLDKLMKGRW